VSFQSTPWVHEKIETVTTEDNEKFRAMQARLADLLPRLNERDRLYRSKTPVQVVAWGFVERLRLLGDIR
jgi:hypothetical protein